jgi:hypothetical protein
VAAQAPRVAIDTAAARVVVEAWQRQPGDSLACLSGRFEDDVLLIESAEIAYTCMGPGVVGQVGFIANENVAESDAVITAMARVLVARPDLLIAGEVYGALPVNYAGQILFSPRAWWAVRRPDAT